MRVPSWAVLKRLGLDAVVAHPLAEPIDQSALERAFAELARQQAAVDNVRAVERALEKERVELEIGPHVSFGDRDDLA